MLNISNILRGHLNELLSELGLASKELEALAEKRLAICSSCSLRDGNRCSPDRTSINIDTQLETRGCGCRLSAKTLDPTSACPLGLWKEHNDNELISLYQRHELLGNSSTDGDTSSTERVSQAGQDEE